ncbi:methylenetetrahydrofolate reductase [NAD(P)H] [Flexibacterium corallicola]|uniref:methylenetetrahydrofolate reductase [NAD(P)H] n=1 Tax=Flexibacterium corallicola TaxID=3037259 RepID=UPI00286F5EF5|nr:methylenetetrahydrofolate reductase [NAD(P)H] [Pseudovibrio sp. M1P-2-3]
MSEHAIDRRFQLNGASDISVSFEFFPPKTEKMDQILWQSITRLAPLHPSFVSVTYGAGGSTRERTHATVQRIVQETDLKPAAHLTCVDATKDSVNEVIRSYWDAGVRHIVALRGDPAAGLGAPYHPHPEGYQNTCDLVASIREIGDFEVSVSAYPERHPQSPSWEVELDVLKAKVDAGATRAITQFFFDNVHYLRYVERVRAAGINIPIIPGIVPVTSFKGISGFAKKTGASVPQWLAHRFEGLDDDPKTRELVAAAVAAEQVMGLVDEGIDDFHFYTMNKADLVYATCHMLGLRPAQPELEPIVAAA